MTIRFYLPLMMLSATLSSGCTSLGVKPWERDVLARRDMQLDADPLDAAIKSNQPL